MTIQSRPSPMDPPCPVPTLYCMGVGAWGGGGGMHDSLPKPCRGSSMSKSPEGDKKYSNLFIHGLIHPFRPSHKNPRRHLVAIHVTSAIRLPCGWSIELSRDIHHAALWLAISTLTWACALPYWSWRSWSHAWALMAGIFLDSWVMTLRADLCLIHSREKSSMMFITDLCCGRNSWLFPWCSSLILIVVQMADFFHGVHHWSLL